MLSIKLLAIVALAGLAEGKSVTVQFPDQVRNPDATLVADNLLLGALRPHAHAEILDRKACRIQLVANDACGCFGRTVKAGEVVLVLDFLNGTDPDVALALVDQLLAGKLHDRLKVGSVQRSTDAAIAAERAKAEAEAKAKAEADAKAEAEAKAKAEADAKAEAEAKAKAEAEAKTTDNDATRQPPAGPATSGNRRHH